MFTFFKHFANFVRRLLVLSSHILFCCIGRVVQLNCLLGYLGSVRPAATRKKTGKYSVYTESSYLQENIQFI